MFIGTSLMLSLPKSALLVNAFAVEQLFCIKIALNQQYYVGCVICILYTWRPPPPQMFCLNLFVFSMKSAVMVVFSAHITV